jgi:hypothetical protein
MTTIIGIKVQNRNENAQEVQKILTNYGCSIRTRIGLHEEINGQCSPKGLILLEVTKNDEAGEIVNELCNIENVEIQQMVF